MRTEGREQGRNIKAGEECMNTEYNQRVPGALAIYHHFQVISPLFSFSTHLYNPEHPPCESLPFQNIISHPRCQHRTLGARSYRDRTSITHTSPTSWFRRNIGVRALLTIDRADACGLSTAERTGSPVFHTLWSYVLAFWLKGNIALRYGPHCIALSYGTIRDWTFGV